jgi:hypothetical protein
MRMNEKTDGASEGDEFISKNHNNIFNLNELTLLK